MRYAEYPPDPPLAPYVRCFWVFESGPPACGQARADERIVPDGHPELIFHFGDVYAELGTGTGASRQATSVFAGQITQALVLRPSGHAGVLGVRFTPTGARRFVGLPLNEATDQRIPLRDLWGPALDTLSARLAECTHDAQRIGAVRDMLLARAARASGCKRAPGDDPAVDGCVAALHRCQGRLRMDEMCRLTGLSERQLERRFNAAAGVSPKLLASILRFRSLFDVLNQSAAAPWLSAALDSGYFDQAHMLRDFRRFAGQTPQAFCRDLAGLSAALVGQGAPA